MDTNSNYSIDKNEYFYHIVQDLVVLNCVACHWQIWFSYNTPITDCQKYEK